MRPPHPNPLASREILLLCARENNLAIVSRKRMKPTQSVLQAQKLGRGTGGRIVLTGKIFREAMRLSALVNDMKQVSEVDNVHDVHVWSITSGMYALSAHVQTANLPLNECAPILLSLETMLRDRYHIGHSTLQFECYEHRGKCSEIDGLYCQMEEKHEHVDEDPSTVITQAQKG